MNDNYNALSMIKVGSNYFLAVSQIAEAIMKVETDGDGKEFIMLILTNGNSVMVYEPYFSEVWRYVDWASGRKKE